MSSYRVWCIINPPCPRSYWYVDGPAAGAFLIAAASKVPMASVWYEAYGLEVYEDDEWQEWCSEDGDSITDVMDTKNAP